MGFRSQNNDFVREQPHCEVILRPNGSLPPGAPKNRAGDEIPESRTLARQLTRTLAVRTVTEVFPATHPHKFAWYAGDPAACAQLLQGRRIVSAEGCGPFVDLWLEDDVHLVVSDGLHLRLYAPDAAVPEKIPDAPDMRRRTLSVCTVAMYGGNLAFRGDVDNPCYRGARARTSPPDAAFDAPYFVRRVRCGRVEE